MENNIIEKKSNLSISAHTKRMLSSGAFWKAMLYKFVRFSLLFGLSFIIIFPILVKISSTFMSYEDILDKTVVNIPRNPTLDNIKLVLQFDYVEALRNTFLISAMCAVLQVFVAAVVGYGFAKFKFKGKFLLFLFTILLMIIPPQTILLPMYMQFRFFDIYGILQLLTGKPLNMVDTLWAPFILSITGLGLKNGLYIFVMQQFFKGAPDELIDAAYIDGASVIKAFYKIILPIGTPILLVIFLLSFSWQWTDTFYSLIFFAKIKVLPNILSAIAGSVELILGKDIVLSVLLNSGVLMILMPLLVLYLFTQRYFIEGIERSGITG